MTKGKEINKRMEKKSRKEKHINTKEGDKALKKNC